MSPLMWETTAGWGAGSVYQNMVGDAYDVDLNPIAVGRTGGSVTVEKKTQTVTTELFFAEQNQLMN